MSSNRDEGAVRLQVRMARSGVASRRKCEELIAQGRVQVNGKTVIQPGTKVSESDEVTLDKVKIGKEKKLLYIALHKPAGFLCSDSDPDGRPLAKSLLASGIKERLFHVGRLDYMTSGLIFYTNDGQFSRALTHPSRKIEKEYLVTTKNVIPEEFLERFKTGIVVEGVRYKARDAVLVGPRTAKIILTEGKNRELRRVFLAFRLRIRKVHRVRIGAVRLKNIPPGHFRHLSKREVQALLKEKRQHGSGY